MRLLSEGELSIRPVREGSDTEPPVSEILLGGKSTGRMVQGAILEAAIACGPGYLVFLTDDIPQEDTLSIYLFGDDLKQLDAATLGGIYSTGSFHCAGFSGPDVVRFRFIDDREWSVVLLSVPELRLPFLSEPSGVHRRFGFSRHFRILNTPVHADR